MKGEVPGPDPAAYGQSGSGEVQSEQVEYRGPLQDATKLPIGEAVRPPPGIGASDPPPRPIDRILSGDYLGFDNLEELALAKSNIIPAPEIPEQFFGMSLDELVEWEQGHPRAARRYAAMINR